MMEKLKPFKQEKDISAILKDEERETLNSFLGNMISSKRLTLLCKDCHCSEFHSSCDGKPGIVVLIESSLGKKFGAYTSKAFSAPESGEWVSDADAFIFSITSK